MNSNGKTSTALHNGTYCATKTADSDTINITTDTPADCTTYDVVRTCDSWATIAFNNDVPLDTLLSFNSETDAGSSTCDRDIKIPVELDSGSCDEFGVCSKTYYTVGYVTSSVSTPYSYQYTIKLGALPLPIANITSANVSASSVLASIDDFRNYILKKNLGEVAMYPGEETPAEIDINMSTVFQAHAANPTNNGMTINSVGVTCDATQCLANIDVTAENSISTITPNIVNSNSIVYMPLKFTVEFNGTPASCFAFTPATGTITDYYYTTPGCPSKVKIPSTIGGVAVTTIGASALASSNLTKIYVPSSITSVAAGAFSSNNFTDGVIWNANINTAGDGTTGPFGSSSVASIIFGGNVTKIPSQIFKWSNVTSSSLVIPDTIATIGAEAFRGNVNIHSITVPSSVTSVGCNAFGGTNLTGGVVWNANIDSVGDQNTSPFASSNAASVTFGSNVTKIPNYLFMWGNVTFTSIVVPSTITSIGNAAFRGNTNIHSVTIPSSVNSVASNAFGGTNLTGGVVWNANITTVGDVNVGPFAGANAASVTFGNITKIPRYLFMWGTTTMTSVTIPSTVTTIGEAAFRGDSSITSINTVPNSVTLIESNAFGGTGLTSVTIDNYLGGVTIGGGGLNNVTPTYLR